jgi:hypothetical protein
MSTLLFLVLILLGLGTPTCLSILVLTYLFPLEASPKKDRIL